MKVLITHELFAPVFAGGGEYVALETARGLRDRGVDVRVLTTGDPAVTGYDGLPTARLPIHRYRMNLAVRAVMRHARDVDLIHTFNYHACLPSLIAGRRLGKPVVCLILGLFGEAWKGMRGPLAARAWMAWERFLTTRRFSRMIFLSDYSREQGIAMGVDPGIAITNCPGIELPAYGPAPEKRDEVLFVGKLEARKGIHDLLAAAERLPDVHFRVMGWGEEEDRLKAQAARNVEFVTFERGAPLRAAFARARIFVLPTRAETFGIAVLEAMASGCAVISTIPLPYEGERIRPGDLDGLVSAIRRLWSGRDQTDELGRTNHARAQEFTWDRFTTRLLAIYDDVLASDRRQPAAGVSARSEL